MSVTIIFLLVLLICFGIVLYFTQSTETEIAVRRRLTALQKAPRGSAAEASILKQERLSPSPWLHDTLLLVPGADALLKLTKQAGSTWFVSSTLMGSLALALVGAIIATLRWDSDILIILTALVFASLPILYLVFLRYQKLQKCSAQLPQAVDLMARALRSGNALNAAIEMVSQDIPEPLASEFRMVYEEQALGLPLRDALMNLLDRMPSDDMRFLTTALLLQKETGGNLVQILDTTSHVMKERGRIRGQIKIYTAQARVSAWVVSIMPFVMFLLMNMVSPGFENIMLNDPQGRMVFYGGLVLWAIGVLTIRKMMQFKL